MVKIVFVGAGSIVFAKTLLNDILQFPVLQDSHFVFMDINAGRLKDIVRLAQIIIQNEGFKAKISATQNRLEALKGANYVINMVQIGGLEAYRHDVEIPIKYGINQCVGDTLGPGGMFRAFRTIPFMLDLCREMERVCPHALLLNYVNPMATNCLAVFKNSSIRCVGLCHSVQGTASQLAQYAGVDFKDVTYWAAGINHMSFYLKIEYQGKDLYPRLWKKMHPAGVPEKKDTTRYEMMKALGYFITESSGHLSEYLPFYRKRKDLLKKFMLPGFGGEPHYYYNRCVRDAKNYKHTIQNLFKDKDQLRLKPLSLEYGAPIINAEVTDTYFRMNGNVYNRGLISNLPEGCCVEVPCLVDSFGIHPCVMGNLPEPCAALIRSNVNVQLIGSEAAVRGDRDMAYQSILMDPLTAAVLAPHEIRRMVDEMFIAEKKWLPQFSYRLKRG